MSFSIPDDVINWGYARLRHVERFTIYDWATFLHEVDVAYAGHDQYHSITAFWQDLYYVYTRDHWVRRNTHNNLDEI